MTSKLDIDSIIELAEFSPTEAMRLCKSAFWARVDELPMVDPERVTLAQAINVTNNSTLPKWWKMPGFVDYFTNKYEWKSKIEYLATLSLEIAEDILLNPKVPAAAKVAMIKIVNDFANKAPQRKIETKMLDEVIAGKSEKELIDYIKKNRNLIESSDIEDAKEALDFEKHKSKSKKKKKPEEIPVEEINSDQNPEDSGEDIHSKDKVGENG